MLFYPQWSWLDKPGHYVLAGSLFYTSPYPILFFFSLYQIVHTMTNHSCIISCIWFHEEEINHLEIEFFLCWIWQLSSFKCLDDINDIYIASCSYHMHVWMHFFFFSIYLDYFSWCCTMFVSKCFLYNMTISNSENHLFWHRSGDAIIWISCKQTLKSAITLCSRSNIGRMLSWWYVCYPDALYFVLHSSLVQNFLSFFAGTASNIVTYLARCVGYQKFSSNSLFIFAKG